MRKLRKQPVAAINCRDFDREPGDRVYESMPELEGAFMHDLRGSTGRNKRDAGELTSRVVKKSGKRRLAVFCGDAWYWAE